MSFAATLLVALTAPSAWRGAVLFSSVRVHVASWYHLGQKPLASDAEFYFKNSIYNFMGLGEGYKKSLGKKRKTLMSKFLYVQWPNRIWWVYLYIHLCVYIYIMCVQSSNAGGNT